MKQFQTHTTIIGIGKNNACNPVCLKTESPKAPTMNLSTYTNDSGGNTSTANFTAYANPYLVVSQDGNYTKHIYIGSQRIVSKLGDLDSYGADPRRIDYAGSNVDGASIAYANKYSALQQTIKDRYAKFEVEYLGKDNDDYVNGQGFCCDDMPANAPMRAPSSNDNPELFQYYYHSDHLGSTSLITNLDGEVVQHIEYVPFGEVFIEERNNKWNTPYLFNAKELDEETGLYYYGARYYDSRVSLWLGADPMQEKTPNQSTYNYCSNDPINRVDPDGLTDYNIDGDGVIYIRAYDNSKTDRLFNAEGDYITISDQKLLPQLIKWDGSRDQATAETGNAKDAFNVFKFAVDNSNVEWSVASYKNDNGNPDFILNTSFNKEEVANKRLGRNLSDMIFHVHSHPGNESYSREASGHTDGTNFMGGDLEFMAGNLNAAKIANREYPNDYPRHYIYHKNSSDLLHYNHQTGRTAELVGHANSAKRLRMLIDNHKMKLK